MRSVTISLKREIIDSEKRTVFKISDSGEGISEKDWKHIFEKFYQCDTAHKHEGNGLGLAQVKEIVKQINGEVLVESKVGEGSTFTVI